jgi:hypothetical protein
MIFCSGTGDDYYHRAAAFVLCSADLLVKLFFRLQRFYPGATRCRKAELQNLPASRVLSIANDL